jgi:hypothetical protein
MSPHDNTGPEEIFYQDFLRNALTVDRLQNIVDVARHAVKIGLRGADVLLISEGDILAIARIIMNATVEPPLATISYAGCVFEVTAPQLEQDLNQSLSQNP